MKTHTCRKLMALILSILTIIGASTASYANTTDPIRPSEVQIEEDGIWINGVFYSPDEFQDLLDASSSQEDSLPNNGNMPKKTPAAALAIPAGTYLIPGVGEVVITAAGVILLAGTAIKVGSWLGNKISVYLSNKSNQKKAKVRAKIPSRLLKDNGNVNLGKFNQKVKGKNAKKESGGWTIEKDTANHGGREWKLKNKSGSRIASLGKNGEILAD